MATESGLQRQFFQMLMESQFWSPKALENYQRSQLAQLLRHARKNVPFYEHRLDAVLEPNGDIDWDRWHEIPIVRRRDMIDHRTAMQARELPPGHGPTGSIETSGSSGIAIALTTNRLSAIANNCLRWRCHVWNGLDWSGRLCVRDGNDPAIAAPPDGLARGPWGPSWIEAARRGRIWQINKLAGGEDVLRLCARMECAYVNTGPKTAHTLALDALRLGLEIRIEAFLCQGEAVNDDDREICRRVFGARLVEHYSSKEAGQTAHVCPAGSLHINAECVLAEIVDSDGRPCRPGETGRIVVTPFLSTGQPLIRYEQGDYAVAGATCSCGRSLPVLGTVVGRQLAMFRHPDGRAVVQILSMDARRALHCEYMQVAQVGPNDYEVRYVPKANEEGAEEALFLAHFRRTFFDDAKVTLRPVDTIPLTASGKLLEYVNEWHRTH